MSISSDATRKAGPFTCNGIQTAFSFTFKVFQASDVLVKQVDLSGVESTLALTTNYTVSLNADQDNFPGGTVTTNTALPSGYLLTLGSQVAATQSVVLTNNGGFYPTVINTALDKLTILVQQLKEIVGRALTLPFSASSSVSAVLPFPQAARVIGWDPLGQSLQNYDAAAFGTSIIGAQRTTDTFVTVAGNNPYTLSAAPLTVYNTDVFMGGVYQPVGSYTLVGNVLTINAPGTGLSLEVKQNQGIAYPVTTLTAGSVTSAAIAAGAVTPSKLSTGAPTWDSNYHGAMGVSPSAWTPTVSSWEVNGVSIYGSSTTGVYGTNYYYDGTNYKAQNTGFTLAYRQQNDGSHVWQTSSASVTTGNNFTFTERFRIGPAGQWGIGGANYGAAGQGLISGGPSAPPTWGAVGYTGNSMVRLNTANGYGSTNTKIPRFTNTVTNQGSDITYADSATLGASFTINTSGVYSISFTANASLGDAGASGISLNTANPTTALTACPTGEVLAISGNTSAANQPCCAAWTGYLAAGAVVRPHTTGSSVGTVTTAFQFTIARVS